MDNEENRKPMTTSQVLRLLQTAEYMGVDPNTLLDPNAKGPSRAERRIKMLQERKQSKHFTIQAQPFTRGS